MLKILKVLFKLSFAIILLLAIILFVIKNQVVAPIYLPATDFVLSLPLYFSLSIALILGVVIALLQSSIYYGKKIFSYKRELKKLRGEYHALKQESLAKKTELHAKGLMQKKITQIEHDTNS